MAENLKKDSSKKIVIHACCGICSGYPISFLQDNGYEVVVYFYNPNIYPKEEYDKRLEAQKIICRNFSCELIEGDYNTQEYYDAVQGFENEPEKGLRCDICFKLRLEKTAQLAKNSGIDCFTTSMVISPHKNYEKLTKIGQEIAKEYGLTYISTNFRKNDGFLKTNNISKSLSLYRQKYCGCKFSIQ